MSAVASLDRVFEALADPTRRQMLERLSLGPASVSQLAEPLPISLPAVVQHLKLLEGSGLVRSEKLGRVRTCHIEPAALKSVEQWISARRAGWERRFDRLGALLDEVGSNEPAASASRGEARPASRQRSSKHR
jgi:DNA-binding transcriptional ArsR family regulator